MQVNTEVTPFSFEMSPKTITPEKLRFLYQNGVDRVSIGIQSFVETELKALGRPQKNKEVFEALSMIRAVDFSSLNIDLIYGTYGQTPTSWLFSLKEAMTYKPEEIFIYPLYTRPLTGNALKKEVDYYTPDDIYRMKANDPHVEFNLIHHPSKGLPCRAGNTTFSVNGVGDITRCHFIKDIIGNIYAPDFEQKLFPRLCTNDTCGCHIGYVHLEKLQMENFFGERLLERIAEKF